MVNEVDYRDSTPNKFPQDYDPAKVDPRVKLRSESIRHKQKGVDVRGAIHQGLEISSVTATEAKTTALDTASRQDAVDQSQKDFEDRYNEQIAGNTDLNEVIDSRKPKDLPAYATLGERLDDLYHGQKLQLGLDLSVIEKIATKAKTINHDASVLKIGHITDLHFQKLLDTQWYGNAVLDVDHVKMFGLFADKLNVLVLNGDQVHGQEIGENGPNLTQFEGSRKVLMSRNDEVMSTADYYSGDADVFANIGNHDDGSVRWDNPLTLNELKQAYGVDSFDTYKDYAEQKVRLIVLNVFNNIGGDLKRATNSVISQSQLDWLVNDALKVPEGFVTIVFTHAPLEGFFDNKPYSDTWKNINHDLVKGVLTAFTNGVRFSDETDNGKVDADFTSQGKRDIIGVVSGHEHRDATAPEIHNGIRGIERTCSVGVGDGRVLGEFSELASDVIEIDTTKRHVKFNRIGFGTDLEFDY
ncbi:metallophosphoesterase [Latilactobacillus curvatus]|uniref:metallophosphoesterase family protein n=1 Tax=Latilactobacillus curvatus TaxID=28038 RepID=UPI0020C75123|nr:metallophosphoesterase [Latilactobacillus curvatus]MCP8849192.1 metallophosphoesterase [Latilactobacillus curvatus]